MPTTPRPRRYDSAKVRAAVRAQFGCVREVVLGLSDARLAGPSGLGDWTVRELAVHLTMAPDGIVRALEGPAPAKADTPLTAWALGTASRAALVEDVTRSLAAEWPDLAALYERTAARLDEALDGAPEERLVQTVGGAMPFTDYLVTRTVELVVHSDDLAHATGAEVPFDRQALATCTRLLADTLAAKAPGASTEVRVPPFAVVQCVPGPRHTRGTPPSVVETDPLTWIRIATGRADWRTEVEAGRVTASGERADLEAQLPVLS
jgi:uncharacterized protein (TIGR03083 family)